MSKFKWKVGDWAIYGMEIVQITRLDEYTAVSTGVISASGNGILEQLRPLTLSSKVAAESFHYYYKELDKIDGHNGFNYPDISSHFNWLCLRAIDNPKDNSPYNEANEFLRQAKIYEPVIQGIKLFRRAA